VSEKAVGCGASPSACLQGARRNRAPPGLPHRSHRRPVAHPGATDPRTQARWPPAGAPAPRVAQRDTVLAAGGLRLAAAAPRPAALPDRLPLLPLLAAGRPLGAHPAGAARPGAGAPGPAANARRCDPGQPSVKTTEKGAPHGYDGAKKLNGRKRHLLVDTLGLLLAVHVTPADVSDRDGAVALLQRLDRRRMPRLRYGWADGGYRGAFLGWALARCKIAFEVVRPR
jgi:hypothetical protein